MITGVVVFSVIISMGTIATYTVNENYFNNIITANQAYILGFIYADGHVGKCGLTITIQERDIEILNFILSQMESNHPIFKRFVRQGKYVGFNINRIKIRDSLRTIGIPINKSKNNLCLPLLNKTLMPHFIRGLFDGDGSVWFSGGDDISCGFSGGENFMIEIQAILKSIGVNSNIRYRYGIENKYSCGVEFKGIVQVGKLYDYLYKDAEFYLKRKFDKMIIGKNRSVVFLKAREKYDRTNTKIVELYKNGLTQKRIHEVLNVPFSSVRNQIQKMRKRENVN